MAEKRRLNVAIVGAGMSGLCMAAKLQDAGIDTYTIFEAADEIGGTWRDNTYPGLHCDVPSRLYTYSFGRIPSGPTSYRRERRFSPISNKWRLNAAFVGISASARKSRPLSSAMTSGG
jgi:cation diffusion facilitator CzcD-associated flavoprotein CzcO